VDRSENGRRVTVCGSSSVAQQPDRPQMIATNAAALAVAEQHNLPAPRLPGADLDGRDTGTPATVEPVIMGSSAWPAGCPTDLLRAAGAAFAQLHTIVLEPRPELPFRPRPIAVDDFRQRRPARTDADRRAAPPRR
jgi:hypothetical protein